MNSYLGREEQALHRAVGEVLHYLWDPIGVAGAAHARDEYDGYIDQVCALVWAGVSAADISAHLVRIANDSMGISDTRDRADIAANKILEWHHAVTR